MKTAYIYRIVNLVNGLAYIGSTEHPYERRIAHFSNLRHGRHKNTPLKSGRAS
jgi:hypothetical protein